jgi:hypothetical protein
LSAGVNGILDAIVEQFGEIELSAEEAEAVIGSTKAIKVKDMGQTALLQYALMQMHVKANELVAMVESMRPSNRAQRRAAKKGIIIP